MELAQKANNAAEAGRSGILPQTKKSNSFVFFLLRLFLRPALFMLYRFRFDMKSSKGIRRPCLVLANHQTGFDQFAVSMGFKFGINYVATDTIFRHGFLSKIMVALVRPIPFSKGSSDLIALKNMMAVIRGGGCVGMFPSGNRSFFGDECKIVPGIGKLAKKFNAPLVLVQIRGGFNTRARWHAKRSLGKTTAFVSRVVQPEEMAAMTSAEVDAVIQRELSFNEFEWNRTAQVVYRGRHKAEYLESVLFYCPQCKSASKKFFLEEGKGLRSKGNEFFCQDCGARAAVNGTGFFEKIHNAENIPETILEWSRLQIDFVKNFDFSRFASKPAFSDGNVIFSSAERAKKEHFLGKGAIELYADRLCVCAHDFPFAEITTAITGVRKMTIYRKNEMYAVLAPDRTNLMKYMICAYHLRNKMLDIQEEYYGY